MMDKAKNMRAIEMQVRITSHAGRVALTVIRDGTEVLNVTCDEGQNPEWIANGAALSVACGVLGFIKPKQTDESSTRVEGGE
jgi:hypothetical protein